MAACVAACKLPSNKLLVHSVFAKDAMLSQSLRLYRREVFAYEQGERGANGNCRTLCTAKTKRKLVRTDVTKRWNRLPLEQTTNALRHRHRPPRYWVFNEISKNATDFPGVSICPATRNYGGFYAPSSRSGLHQRGFGVTLMPVSNSQAQSFNSTDVSSPKAVHPLQCMRQFSSRHGNRGEEEEEEEEERKRRLRGAVMYISNPLTWVTKKWNTAKLRRKYDPSFSENEFLFGARQAVCHVTQTVSQGKFEELAGIVEDEIIEWFKDYRTSLSSAEQEALALDVDDVVLMKIRHILLDSEEDKELVYVDSVCFGLKLIDTIPYLVDMGIRFKRDYSTDPADGWVVAGVTHVRLQNLAPE